MTSGLVPIVQQIAQNAMDNSQMTDLRFGTVISTAPLKIKISTNLTLPESVLIVPEHLKTHSVSMSIDGNTQNVTIYSGLRVGNKIALLRKQGGQNYYILDRI